MAASPRAAQDTIAVNGYNDAVHAPHQSYDRAAAADGIVGDVLPTAAFYLPVVANGTRFRYWSVLVVPVADMKGSREQDFWYRYQQVQCAGPRMRPRSACVAMCGSGQRRPALPTCTRAVIRRARVPRASNAHRTA